jgi:hypothetical protein
MAVAAAALLAVPAVGGAQAPQSLPAQQAPAPAETAGAPPAQTPAGQPASPAEQPTAPQVDAVTVKRHLTAARDSLSQLTQLPAAAQLSGDARMHVSQLINNFNELITTNTEWRASHAKVKANLTALIGDQRADESPAPTSAAGVQSPKAPAQAPAAGAAGAVGTAGTVTLDPAIQAKLFEFRTHLDAFELAASGAATGAAAPSPSSPASEPQAQPAAPTTSDPPAAPAAPSQPAPATQPAPSTTTSSSAQSSTPGAVGTSGSTARAPDAAGASSSTAAAAQSQRDAATGNREAMRHIEAIEAILSGGAKAGATPNAPAGTSGTAPTLTQAQIEQIKSHLADLKRALNQSGK